mmetsp:Transcript_8562/g.13217  ORF Transcript_8562/g.13217 Transcript_8562/m.13217 type:complete len:135 (+) Transcript_8562:20-424(+)
MATITLPDNKKQDRIQHIIVHLRRLWPKYDVNLELVLKTRLVITKFINHCFIQANLSADFAELGLDQPQVIDRFIYSEAEIDTDKIENEADLEALDEQLSFNQVQIINIMKRAYGDPSAVIPGEKRRRQPTAPS